MIKTHWTGCIVALSALSLFGLVGCGDDGGMSAKDEAALKAHDKSMMHPPTGDQMKPPADFHSSAMDLPGAGGAAAPAPIGPGGPPPGAPGK
jgi:hypothetical protein